MGEPELLGHGGRESLLGLSQMEEDTRVNSGQVCCGSGDFVKFMPLKTKENVYIRYVLELHKL